VTVLADPPQRERALPVPSQRTIPVLALAGVASLGAGAVHAAAAGAHGGATAEVVVFTVLAVAQVAWGAVALTRTDRLVAAAGVLLGAGALMGWALAKSVGIPFVNGLDVVEPVTLPDALAAALAALSWVLAAAATGRVAQVPRAVGIGAVVVMTGIGAVGTAACASHQHPVAHAAGHASHAATHPYDPSLPIDLSGTPGVTPQQQAAAENLVAVTVLRLPHWADAHVALKAGFHSIGDGFTGTEHLVNTAFMHDAHVLDPDHPESLVYDTSHGGRKLVAAMYMLAPGTPLTDVPKIGGALVQWHIHDNLCYSRSGLVQGITNAAGQCPAGLVKPVPTPMVHVWITKNPCGPFAALEGIGGGSIAAGQTRLCDHLHGSTA
jgi:hypothetical protein